MNFNNLTDKQIEWLEQKIEDAYSEGWTDKYYDDLYNLGEPEQAFKESMAKNQTCHILAERHMKPANYNHKYEG